MLGRGARGGCGWSKHVVLMLGVIEGCATRTSRGAGGAVEMRKVAEGVKSKGLFYLRRDRFNGVE